MHQPVLMPSGKDAPLFRHVWMLRYVVPVAAILALSASSFLRPAKASADEPQPGLIGGLLGTTTEVTAGVT
jgi:hypothetical protein